MIAKHIEQEQVEAYRVYMSDLFSVHIKTISGDGVEVPRYYDLVHQKEETQQTSESVIAKFAPLRRKE